MLVCVVLCVVAVGVGVLALLHQRGIERQLNHALALRDVSGVMTAEGTNILNAIGTDAIPTLLRWSLGRPPVWYKIINPIRQKLGKPPLVDDIYQNRNKARVAFLFLRSRGSNAVPTLVRRLSDDNAETRRSTIHMLGAIGPAIGAEAFNALTNRLSDKEDDVRNDVIWALQFHRISEYPPEMLLPVFVRGLGDTYDVARQNAIIGLARMGTNASPVRAAIEKAANDADPGVSGFAQQWLKGQYLPD